MALAVNQIKDAEIARQKKNLTDSQKKKADATKEGVVVNALIKEPKNIDMNDLYNCLVISDDVKMPEKLYENKNTKEKSLLPISIITTGVMAIIALTSLFVRKNAKINLNLNEAKKIDSLKRNLAINEETHQAIYQMVQYPTYKTILAGIGVLTITAMGFMGKMFVDGFKDIWIKKKEADIQKNLQENLIAVETQSFSGKIQIIRSMLADKAREFSEYLCTTPKKQPNFGSSNNKFKFGTKEDNSSKKSDTSSLSDFALGALTLIAIIGLGFVSLTILTKGKKDLEKNIKKTKDEISKIISHSRWKTKNLDKSNLKSMFMDIHAEPEYIKSELSKLSWWKGWWGTEKKRFIDEAIFDVQKSTAKADKALGGDGPPKPSFYSHVNDYRAFLYNYLLDTKNPQFKQLFFGITAVTAISYGGKAVGEAVKEVQVKKMNAQTELELQKRLVATELRNFKAKKDAAIEPLCEEFYVQLKKGKSKEELKTIVENILFEVKNGPPFVYS